MRENLGLQVAVILFAALSVVLSVATYMYFSGFVEQREKARQTAELLRAAQQRERDLQSELQAVKYVVTENSTDNAQRIQQVHAQDVQRAGSQPSSARPTYQRLVGYLLTAVGEATQQEVRTRADLLALREDFQERTQLHEKTVAIYQAEAKEREQQFAQQRAEDETERFRISTQMQRLAKFAEEQSGELAAARVNFDRMQDELTTQITRINRQYSIVRNRWEATQVDHFEQPDGNITYADARNRSVQINLGSADGLQRGITFQVYDPDVQGIVSAKEKATIEVTRVTGEHSANGRVISDLLRNPILSGDLIFTPLWQSGVQRQFCLLGVLDIDGDGQDDGETIRNLLRRQHAEVEAEVDGSGRRRGEVTAACRYVVVGKRPLVSSNELPNDAYDQMLARAKELGIDQISIDKLLDYLDYRPAQVSKTSPKRHPGPTFRPRFRTTD